MFSFERNCWISFWDSHCVYDGMLDGAPEVSETLFILFCSFCCCFFPDWIFLIDLSSSLLIFSSVFSDLLLSPSNKFFNFSYSTFQLQNFYLALCFTDKFYFLIDILYLVKHHSYTFFNSLDIVSFRSLNIFMLVDLKFFVWKSQLLVFLRDSFPTPIPTPSVLAIVSSFFACLMHLLWKTGHFK